MVFDMPRELSSIIKVVGVGGGGSNAVNHMHESGINDVNFIVCNTDKQALDISAVPVKIQLGRTLTEGRGAGMDPEKGRNATLESVEDIRGLLDRGTRMVFITACLGKGTGTGGAPVIAKIAKEMGILTVALVTMPFSAEGPKRFAQAESGIEELKPNVDALILISNDKLREIYGNLKLTEAFAQANNVLLNAARGIAEIISTKAIINVDFEDVSTVMRNSGVALMGIGVAEGENRALNAVESALTSPLLNDNHIKGARNVLINITSGNDELTVDELTEISEYVQREAGFETNIIWGHCTNENLGNKLSVTIIATGFEAKPTQRIDQHVAIQNQQAAAAQAARQVAPKPAAKPQPEPKQAENQVVQAPPVNRHQPTFFDLEPKKHEEPIFNVVEFVSPLTNTISLDAEDTQQRDYPVINKSVEDAEKDKLDKLPQLNERVTKLRSLSLPLNNGVTNYEDIEKQPAFMRRQVSLKDYPKAADNQQSNYVSKRNDVTGEIEIRPDNGFLYGQNQVD
jgi:cell division protein FtsZ